MRLIEWLQGQDVSMHSEGTPQALLDLETESGRTNISMDAQSKREGRIEESMLHIPPYLPQSLVWDPGNPVTILTF